MNYFEWASSLGKHAGYLGKTAEEEEQITWRFTDPEGILPPLEQWQPLTLTQYLGEGPKLRKPKKVGDSPSSGRFNLISQAAADALHDIWEKEARLYPVFLEDVPGQPYYIVTPTVSLDCLDHEKSEFDRDGGGIPCMVKQWVIREEIVGDHDLFNVEIGSPRKKYCGYWVSERFVQRVVDAKLKGFCFSKYFPDPKPFIS